MLRTFEGWLRENALAAGSYGSSNLPPAQQAMNLWNMLDPLRKNLIAQRILPPNGTHRDAARWAIRNSQNDPEMAELAHLYQTVGHMLNI